ncbi:MAG: sulfatase-like hydrolase/transferase [Novosphingobium sp.]|uniref:sulfatase-like hydrolase/transferase n=1 Tax=Novosphingobium sp. TaxID=1874826 RepID=UPI003B9BB9CD
MSSILTTARRAAIVFGLLGSTVLTGTGAHAGDIIGKVIGADGKPLSGVSVTLDDAMRAETTDSQGHFRFDRVPEGSVTINLNAMFRATQHLTVDVPLAGEVEIAAQMKPNTLLARAAALNTEPAVEHAAQKQTYLAGIKKTAQAGKAPNIVIMFFDDLGYGDLSAYGNRLISTPNIDAMATRGAKLTQSYSSSPVCTPSRAALMTGRLPVRSHAQHHVFFPTGHPVATMRRSLGWANALPRDEITMAEALGKAGYTTGAFGKWHLGDVVGSRPTDLGFNTYYGVLYSNDMAPLALYRGTNAETPPDQVVQGKLNERFADEAIKFISASKDKPFFAYVPFTAPHWPHHANPDRAGKSAGGEYGDVIEDLDAQVGRIVATLDKEGLSENTIIIITSDNGGDYDGAVSDLRGRKGETWEGGQRVPQFVAWPGVARPGSVIDGMTMNIDMFPTLLAAAGVALPTDRVIDGKDIRPLLSGQAQSPHDALFYLTTWSGNVSAVRNKDFKYREVIEDNSPLGVVRGGAGHPTPPALYDLALDNESHNTIARHPMIAEQLKKALDTMRDQLSINPRGWTAEAKKSAK